MTRMIRDLQADGAKEAGSKFEESEVTTLNDEMEITVTSFNDSPEYTQTRTNANRNDPSLAMGASRRTKSTEE